MHHKFYLFWIILLIPALLSVVSPGGNDLQIDASINGKEEISKEIGIGLLVPENPANDPLSMAAVQGATLAIENANRLGGYNGNPFRLMVRSTEGLWGAGSKEAVKSVYDDEVCAIITALDGRNAHLVEQVASKSQIVQLSTRAMDVTLSQAYVPWFFRIVPNDNQQAKAMISDMIDRQNKPDILIYYKDSYDHKYAAEAFRKEAEKSNLNIVKMESYEKAETSLQFPETLLDPYVSVLFGTYSESRPLIDMLQKTISKTLIYGSYPMTTDESFITNRDSNTEGMIFVSSNFCYTSIGQSFKDQFMEKYNQVPNPAASYAFDGAQLIISAVLSAGENRERIRDYLKKIEFKNGATGIIKFDAMGNRDSDAFMLKIIKGHPVILKK